MASSPAGVGCVSFADVGGLGGDRCEIKQRLLEEFDIEVEARVAAMKNMLEVICNRLHGALKIQMVQIPKSVRGMRLGEFQAQFQTAPETVANQQLSLASHAVSKALHNTPIPSKSLRRTVGVRVAGGSRQTLMAVSEEDEEETIEGKENVGHSYTFKAKVTTKSARVTRTTTRSTRSLANRSNTLNSNSSNFVTPAASKTKTTSRIQRATPAFDARLPKTPYMRTVRRGESIMSARGSPLAFVPNVKTTRATMEVDCSVVTVPVGNGKFVEFSSSEEFDGKLTAMSKKAKREAKDNIQKLQTQLQMMMQKLAA